MLRACKVLYRGIHFLQRSVSNSGLPVLSSCFSQHEIIQSSTRYIEWERSFSAFHVKLQAEKWCI